MILWVYIFVTYKHVHEMQMATSFEYDLVIHGYHIYRDLGSQLW